MILQCSCSTIIFSARSFTSNLYVGTMHWLLDTAAEQEQKEILLAYAFLWNGQPVPQPLSYERAKTDVDNAIEKFLRGDIQADEKARGSSHVRCFSEPVLSVNVIWSINSSGPLEG